MKAGAGAIMPMPRAGMFVVHVEPIAARCLPGMDQRIGVCA
jgi:hypothetical protein